MWEKNGERKEISFHFGVTFRRFCEEKGKKERGKNSFFLLKKGNKSRAYYNLLESDINLFMILQLFQLSVSGCREISLKSIEIQFYLRFINVELRNLNQVFHGWQVSLIIYYFFFEVKVIPESLFCNEISATLGASDLFNE